jgi:pimeloyl-ACP methyl ester carboxylesterase
MAIYGRPWGADPGAIACPAVMWQGTGDVIVPADVAFDLGRRIPGCVVHRLEGQGHFWVFAHVGEVLREVAAMASE